MKSKILEVIEEKINPMLGLHNGACELVDVSQDGIVLVSLTGGCAGCPSAKLTMMNGVVPILMDNVPGIKDVLLA